jgi:riboflavin synthase
LGVRVEPGLLDYLTQKGSIAIDGVSLTIAAMRSDGFEVALIPTTLELTSLGQLSDGQQVNLETDIIARTTVAWLRRQFGRSAADGTEQGGDGAAEPAGVTRSLLEDAGFADMA